jgi:hypothetical protein
MDAATTSGTFAGSTLADKLHKLNASQQSIESIHSSFLLYKGSGFILSASSFVFSFWSKEWNFFLMV